MRYAPGVACLDEPTVLAFVGGRVTDDSIDEHLADCRSCRDLVVLAARTTFASGSPAQPVEEDGALPAGERYTISGLLGAGGQALVYTAHDTVLGRTVALKILRDAHDAKVLEEARLAARLSHPNIIAIHDAGALRDGQLYLAMEYVAGGSLDVWLRKTRPSRSQILRACCEAGWGLATAHGAGIVHRDIKAANILIGDDGRARVTDFGLATASGAARGIAGTLAYMAPEQLDGTATPASDQFSFAVTVWEALSGTLPFRITGDRAAAVLAGIVEPEQALPRSIDRALRRALDPEPAKRWPSINALVHTLSADPYRTRKRAGIAVVLLGAAGASAFMLARDRTPSCEGLGAPVQAIWNPLARSRIETAFTASGKPFARGSLPSVLAQLETYAMEATSARIAACKASSTGGQSAELLDLRNSCLDDATLALRATIDTLSTGDAGVIEHAFDVLRGLPPITACADGAWLRERVRPPTDRATRDRVAEIAKQLATSNAELRAGKLKEAFATAQTAATAASTLDHAPTRARAELTVGKARALLGESVIAEKHLQEAAQLAQRGRDDRTAAEAWIELVKVIGHANARYDEALRYAGFAEATAARLGDDKELRGTLHFHRCAILDLQAKLEDGELACATAAKLRSERFGPETMQVADVLVVQARLAHKRSQPDRARQLIGRAVAIRERVFGPDHPALMEAMFAKGQLALGTGHLDEAEQAFARGMAIVRMATGEDSLQMAALYSQQSALELVRGQLDKALVAIDRSTAIRERVEGKDHPDLVFNFNQRGRILDDLGKLPDAVAAYERALQLAERALGPKHPSVSAILQDLGRTQGKLGKPKEARALLDRAIDVAKASEEPAAIAAATTALAELLHMANKPREALPLYQSALATYEGLVGLEHPMLIATLTNLGLAHIDVRDPKGAIAPLERAIAIESKRTGEASPQLLLPLSSLAEAQLALGQWAAAKQTLTRAIALDKVELAFPDDVAKLKKKLARLR